MSLFEDPGEGGPEGGANAPEFTVSEISGAVKRVIEGEFGHVRVRGEIGRVSRPSSGHIYFDLKDERAVIAAVSWKGQAARLSVRPEEGMEVIATGRLTTFPGQSKYQLIVEDISPAGQGALMLLLEKRRAALAAEGLFDAARKMALPFLPGVIGVVTSPSGAVIRDILHRLRDRFPRHVLIWPVAVQGEKCAAEVAAAIRGFNALPEGGAIPRPDILIVARGGGSLEDLWGFNEEIVVRAAAESRIPLISAVGHETDTTLIDHAADRRAPTPTAAAEIAVPVRIDLLAWAGEQSARIARALSQRLETRHQRLIDLSRALGRPETLLDPARQRFDLWSDRLGPGLSAATTRKRAGFNAVAGRMQPSLLTGFISRERRHLRTWSDRLAPALQRLTRDAARDNARRGSDLSALAGRLISAQAVRIDTLAQRLASLDRTRQTLGYTETLRRGFAVVRAEGTVVSSRTGAEAAPLLEIEFADGRVSARPTAAPRPRKTKEDTGPDQGDLF